MPHKRTFRLGERTAAVCRLVGDAPPAPPALAVVTRGTMLFVFNIQAVW